MRSLLQRITIDAEHVSGKNPGITSQRVVEWLDLMVVVKPHPVGWVGWEITRMTRGTLPSEERPMVNVTIASTTECRSDEP